MLASLPYNQRVARGRQREAEISARLSQRFTITPATEHEDMIDKIDAYMNGQAVQYKFRESGDDVLLDMFEPFVSVGSPANTPGKDFTTRAEWFAILHRDGRLVLLSKKHMASVFELVYTEWVGRMTFRNTEFDRSYQSPFHPGVRLKITHDHANRRRKLLMFVDSKQVRHIEVK